MRAMNELIKCEQLEVVKALNPKNEFGLEVYSDNLTIKLAYAKPTIHNLCKASAKGDIMKILHTVVSRKLEGMGKRAALSPAEIKTFVLDWIKLRSSETIEDVILMLDMGRRGEFGKIYGDVDVLLLNEWAVKYFDRKYQEIERLIHNQKQDTWNSKVELSDDEVEQIKNLKDGKK